MQDAFVGPTEETGSQPEKEGEGRRADLQLQAHTPSRAKGGEKKAEDWP